MCADLILQGYRAYLSDPGAPYDVVLDIGTKLLRIQVKTTSAQTSREPGRTCYKFELRRRRGQVNRIGYDEDDYDLIALVALDIKRVAYKLRAGQTCLVYLTRNTGAGPDGVTFDDLTLERVL